MIRRFALWVGLLVVFNVATSERVRAEGATFPTFGVAFEPPRETTFDLGHEPTVVGFFQFAKTSPYFGSALSVEAIPAKGKSLDDWSASISKAIEADPGGFECRDFAIG